jgi:hypothetical protein
MRRSAKIHLQAPFGTEWKLGLYIKDEIKNA